MRRLRIVFMGTPDFAVSALQALYDAGHDIVHVYAQPPRPKGRGHQVQLSPVHQLALDLGLCVHTPPKLRNDEELAYLKALSPDVLVVAAYGLILPQAILDVPEYGCYNIHASLLPRWRGAAPIHRALLEGDMQTGVTIMKMDVGLDTGEMILKDTVAITPQMTSLSLQEDLSKMGARLMVEVLSAIPHITLIPQPEEGITYAHKIEKAEGGINWSMSAMLIDRKVRTLYPWPGVWFEYENGQIKIFDIALMSEKSDQPAGTLLSDDFKIVCGDHHVIQVLTLQRPGRGHVSGAEFLRALGLKAGQQL